MMKKLFILIFLIIFCFGGVFALENSSNNTKIDAYDCLQISAGVMNELDDSGFNVNRVNDTLKIANDLFNVLSEKDNPAKKSDYSDVIVYCNLIEDIKSNAYKAKDLIYSIEKEYSSFSENMKKVGADSSEVDTLINNIRQNMDDERYEFVIENVPLVENKIIEVQASATTFNLFYRSVSSGVKEFLFNNVIFILIFIALIFIFIILYKYKLRKIIIQRKIDSLEAEKAVIKELIKKVQKGYFENGNMAEGEYNIKTKKFAELIRDIERQIPLYVEELAKINGRSVIKSDAFFGRREIKERNHIVKVNRRVIKKSKIRKTKSINKKRRKR